MKGVSVVVPVYNSQDSLAPLVERLEPVLRSRAEPFELILVNDGSRDGSWDRIQELAGERPWIRGFDMMRNYGQHNALLCGIRAARFDVVVTMDDDLQHPPEEIPRLLEELARGHDVVYGIAPEEHHGRLRRLASSGIRMLLARVTGSAVARHASAFRAFRTCLRDAFTGFTSPLIILDVLLNWGTSRFSTVKVRIDPRTTGRSNYSLLHLTLVAFDMVTSFSTLPLRLASLVGFAFTLFGLLMLLYVLGIVFFLGGSVPGFPFLASVIAIFAGVQLFALGVIGEYIARIHLRLMDRPTYVIARRTEAGETCGAGDDA